MKILLTGAAGFIGSHLVDRLLAEQNEVVGIDNFSLGKEKNLRDASRNAGFRLIRADLNSVDSYRVAIERENSERRFDSLWHLAANSDIAAGVADPTIDLRNTFLTTFHCLQIAREIGIKQFAFASTSAVYGERGDEIIDEDSGPMFPISNYGAMKLASEALLSAGVESGLERVWIFRFPNVIGGRATHGALHDFLQKLIDDPTILQVLGDGTQQKPYLHVSELVDAMLFITVNASAPLNYFNIGPEGPGATVRFIAETAVRLAAPGADIRYGLGNKGWVGDVPRFNYSVEKLKRFGWKPKLSSEQAVVRALEDLVMENRA